MTQEQSRAEFEAWARGESPSINLTREDGGYRYSLAEMLYGAWQAARAAAPAVPQGWVLVPVVPDVQMRTAGAKASDLHAYSPVGVYAAMLAAAPQPPAAPAPAPVQAGWIPVSERLPEHLQDVIFVVDGLMNGYLHGRVLGGRYHADTDTFSTPGLGVVASHWQPAPQPPKEQT